MKGQPPPTALSFVPDAASDVALKALRRSESRYRRLFETARDGILLLNAETAQIEDVNPYLVELLGYSHLEFLGKKLWEVGPFADIAESKAMFEELQAEGYVRYENLPLRTISGKQIAVGFVSNTYDCEGIKVIQCNIRDITERKRIDAALLAAKSDAERANQAKSRFLAAASHDLSQPLSALSLYFDVLKNSVPPDSNELVGHIQVCIDSLNGLLTDLLDVSKLEAGVVKVELTDVALDDLVAPLVSVLSVEARQQGLRLRLREGLSGMVVRTDPQLFKRILGNLIINAIRYTHNGGVLVASRRHKGRQWIEIWDTGIGIPADQTGIIFEEFRQLGDAARNRGSGLGLSIVARMAALLGLEIRLRSRPGRGSMFAVELPPERARVAETTPLAIPLQTRFLRIGLVEDHPAVLQALTRILNSLGHEVVVATGGRSLLERLDNRAPDLVISDYRLAAGETGFGVITAARDMFGESLPAFLITGDTDPALVRSMAERGIAVLFKPLQMAALKAAIGTATARKEP